MDATRLERLREAMRARAERAMARAADAAGTIDRAGCAVARARLALARSAAMLDGIRRRRPSAARGQGSAQPARRPR
jgi:hypothetical protein